MAPQTRSKRASRAQSSQTPLPQTSPLPILQTVRKRKTNAGSKRGASVPSKISGTPATDASRESSHAHLQLHLVPITNVHQAFWDLLSKNIDGIRGISGREGFQLRVGTICSGTEAPVLALRLITELTRLLVDVGASPFLQFDHLFSVENVPFKQAYISRNAPNSIVFSNVVDFADSEATTAPTSLGGLCSIPTDIDLLVAGTSCVDFSNLNTKKKNSIQLASEGDGFVTEWKKSADNPKYKNDQEGEENKSNIKKNTKKGAPLLRAQFYDDVRGWLDGITPEEILEAGKIDGESSITFFSTLCYINRHRPKMVLLENVTNAPWGPMCDLFLRAVKYTATHKFLDTKDYYIPHTRKRGYVIALDNEFFGIPAANGIVNRWKEKLETLERGASAPVQDWLLSAQDPLAMRARQDESERVLTSTLAAGKDNQWSRSKLRHNRVRRDFKLGKDRPLTAWGQGGTEVPYDRIDRLFLKGQNDRALDCMDIYYLRCLHATPQSTARSVKGKSTTNVTPSGPVHYDIRFKSQIFDISQNIDRGQITHPFGVTGCLTPRGLNFITDQGRLVSGFEALNLQGLPLRDLDLSRESQEELRDLAGNAMTTTVVGAALFSLMLSVHEQFGSEASPITSITTVEHTVESYEPPYRPSFKEISSSRAWSTAPEPFDDVQKVIEIAKRCRHYCYCNGSAKYSTEELLRCMVCGAVRCKSCAGNPKHSFIGHESVHDPIMNDAAPQELMAHFPTALKSLVSEGINRIPFHPEAQALDVGDLILSSLTTATFYYTNVHLSDNVTVCYSAKVDDCIFRLQAVVSDAWVTWYLYLDPWSTYGETLKKSLELSAQHLLRPFARVRMSPRTSGYLPKKDGWEFWVFKKYPVNMTISKSSSGLEIISVCLTDLPNETHTPIRSIRGTYDHRPDCDAAENSLHVNEVNSEQPVNNMRPKRYLFKDPTRIGPTQEDCYIISDECRYLEMREIRDFCVKFPPTWTPQTTDTTVEAFIEGYWEMAPKSSTQVQSCDQDRCIEYMMQTGWRSIPSGQDLQTNGDGQMIRTLASVSVESNMIPGTYMTLLKYEQAGPKDWAVVSRSDYTALFDLLAPVNVNLGGIETQIHNVPIPDCSNLCYPNLPAVHWMEKNTDPRKSIREPFRLSYDMREYEKDIRKCGEPLQVVVKIEDCENMKGWKRVTANYEVNMKLLAYAASSHFPKPRDGTVELSVHIEKGSLNIPNLRFKSFKESLQRLSGQSFEAQPEPFRHFLNGADLTHRQRISLDWMLHREHHPPSFSEREIEECRSDHLNLRVLAVAKRNVVCPGGILADDVGYGKTVVSLALMAQQRESDVARSREPSNPQENTTSLAASLVLVPSHLVEQWCDEVLKFLGWGDSDVLTIEKSSDLEGALSSLEPPPKRRKTANHVKPFERILERIKAAKLIIVSTAIFDEDYYKWLGKYAGSLSPPGIIPTTKTAKNGTDPHVLGAFMDWYEDATFHARDHISGFDPAIFNYSEIEKIKGQITEHQEELQAQWKVVVDDYHDTKTRLGQQIEHGDKEKKVTVKREFSDRGRAEVITAKDFEDNTFMHVLEAFHFSRIIYDEFSYDNFIVAQFVKNAKARAKWVLSATPPTSNVKAVCDIGELLNIHVARAVKLRPGLPLITEGPRVLHQDSAWTQLSYGKVFTDKSVKDRVEQAQRFLRHFASANPFDEEGMGKISVSEELHCSYMTRFHLLKYLEMQQDVRNSNMELSAALRRHNLDPKIFAEFPTNERLRAGLALAYVASLHSTDMNDSVEQKILDRRQKLVDAQQEFAYYAHVAIWLVCRRFKEIKNGLEKLNVSATSAIEDLAYEFVSMLQSDAEVFGGEEALRAISESIFTTDQFNLGKEKIVGWDEESRRSPKSLEPFFEHLNQQRKGKPSWATHFKLPADHLASLEDSDVVNWLQEFDPTVADTIKPATAREKLGGYVKVGQAGQPKYPRFNHNIKIRGGNFSETESELVDIMLVLFENRDKLVAERKQLQTAESVLCAVENRKCSVCKAALTDLVFLPQCGHFLCPVHSRNKFCGQDKTGCPSVVPNRSIPAEQIDRCPLITDNNLLKNNSKSSMICARIKEILDHTKDKILLFYQFVRQKEVICDLLTSKNVEFHDITPNSTKRITSSARVRILKLNSEAAAGSNYQDANHVMFASAPVYGKQEDFEMYVKQAQGRAIRYGQGKQVHVYYFVTANTFEVDLLSLRKRSYICPTAYVAPAEDVVEPEEDVVMGEGNVKSEGDTVMEEGNATEEDAPAECWGDIATFKPMPKDLGDDSNADERA
ncbi:hypothetical protein F4808DRAFT_93311 [Astrocystis sublimbata]|nr:hypothetical protein F4808DRAFT_93311 [Astrocystis sublimbata]